MSKYIDLELALNELLRLYEEDVESYGVEIPETFDYCRAREVLLNLPTIEVNEEVLKATKKFNTYTIADENAEMGMRTQIEPIIEVSDDCISREQFREQMYHRCFEVDNDENMQKWDSGNWLRWKLFEEELENAPSVVPTCRKNRQVERAEGEWIKDNLGTVICSECKRPRRDSRINHTKFCNSCGAKMKG